MLIFFANQINLPTFVNIKQTNTYIMKTQIESIKKTGYGHWRVTVKHGNHSYSFTTTNSQAIDKEDGEGDETLLNEFFRVCEENIYEKENAE